MTWIKMTGFLLMNTFFAISMISCKELEKLTQFNLKYNSSVVVPSSSLIDLPLSFDTPEIETQSESRYEQNNTRADLVEEVKLSGMTLTLNSPTESDFSFLKSVSVFLQADGLPEVKIAWQEDIPENIGKIVTMETANDNLKDYVAKDDFTLKVSTITRKTLGSDHEIDVESTFRVDAKVLGL